MISDQRMTEVMESTASRMGDGRSALNRDRASERATGQARRGAGDVGLEAAGERRCAAAQVGLTTGKLARAPDLASFFLRRMVVQGLADLEPKRP